MRRLVLLRAAVTERAASGRGDPTAFGYAVTAHAEPRGSPTITATAASDDDDGAAAADDAHEATVERTASPSAATPPPPPPPLPRSNRQSTFLATMDRLVKRHSTLSPWQPLRCFFLRMAMLTALPRTRST